MGLAVVTLAIEKLKRSSRKKVVISKETLMRRIPRMRGQISKVVVESQSTSSKPFTKESLVQIVLDDSLPHLKLQTFLKSLMSNVGLK